MAAATGCPCLCSCKALKTIFLLIFLSNHSIFASDLQKKVSLGYIWENPRVEDHDAAEVIVDGTHNELRLTCILVPPLPLTKENFISRDKVVKWRKIEKTHGHRFQKTFWSDNQDITAISLSSLKLKDLGTYGCIYGSLMKTINITVSGIDEIRRLPEPMSHSDLEGAVLNVKYMKGLNNWIPLPAIQQEASGVKSFPCPTPSSNGLRANSVHHLQPQDVDIVLSIGGAISAGVAANAKTIPELFRSHKTYSFSIGGKYPVEDFITLPSILKKFNPSLKGAIVREEDFSTMYYGSSVRSLPPRVSSLIKKLRNRQDIDFDTSWKLLTISLDFDDFCVACRLSKGWDDHIKAVVEVLDTLHANVPRLFVNLVLAPNVTQLYNLQSSRECSSLYRKRCECLESKSEEDRTKVLEMQNDFKEYFVKLVRKYDHSPNYTVVLQPFWTDVSRVTDGLFAQDCFHLSPLSQELAAVHLWNNMLQPINMKSNHWNYSKAMRCPTSQHPFLFTSANSVAADDIAFTVSDPAEADFSKARTTSKVKVALGIGLSLLVVVVVVVISLLIYVQQRRPISMADRIRILAHPWKRMKEKV